MSARQDARKIDAAAADWVAREDRGPLTAGERIDLEMWLQVDRRHLGAYARIKALSAHFEASGVATGMRIGSAPVANAGRRRLLRWSAVAASVALASSAGLGGLRVLRERREYATTLGQILRVALEDGSSVILDTSSRIAVEFSRSQRVVSLLAGAALFDVVGMAVRPFVVHAQDMRLVADNTRFSLQQLVGQGLEVLVQTGTVGVLGATGDLPRLHVPMSSVARIYADRPAKLQSVSPLEINRKLSWCNGMLSFNDQALGEIVESFSRYSPLRLVIADADLSRLKVSGLYSASDPEGFAHSVASSLGLQVRREQDEVRLSRR